jgi:hypothetical protein
MNISIVSLIGFLLIWGIPAILVLREILKMSNDEQQALLTEIKSVQFIFTVGFVVLGLLLVNVGWLLSLTALIYIGTIVLAIGGTVCAVQQWSAKKLKSIYIFFLVLCSLAIAFLY